MTTEFNTGYHTTLNTFGLEKTAVSVLHRAPLLRRAGQWLRRKRPTKSGVRDFMVGNPRRFGEELMQGRALGKGSLIRESMKAPGMFSKAMLYGLPAYEAGSIALDDKQDKAKRMGASVGGTALGLAAFRPFGLLGSMAAYELGTGAGGLLGGTAGHLSGVGEAAKPSPRGNT